MKTVLLAGGFGTRISEYTGKIPKPMVEIGGRPILWHIMNTYAFHGYKDFYIALGHKADIVKQYFAQYHNGNSDFSVDLATGKITSLNNSADDWQVTLVDTGINTMTGGRVKRMQSHLGSREPIMLTYGDGVADIDLNSLVDFHKSHGKLVTMTAVRPTARFGELQITENQVTSFEEKPQLAQGWINGGYFVFQPEFFDLIEGDNTMLEREPLEKATEMGQLMAYKHEGFWQCMDTIRDRDFLNKCIEEGNSPWL